jgi:hypothetical protein
MREGPLREARIDPVRGAVASLAVCLVLSGCQVQREESGEVSISTDVAVGPPIGNGGPLPPCETVLDEVRTRGVSAKLCNDGTQFLVTNESGRPVGPVSLTVTVEPGDLPVTVSGTSNRGSCTPGDLSMDCRLGRLPADAEVTIVMLLTSAEVELGEPITRPVTWTLRVADAA